MSVRTTSAPQIETGNDAQTQLEPSYRVIIHNDDITPMDFVIHVLKGIFFVLEPDAVGIMLTAHFEGMAYVQSLPKSEAQARIGKAHFAAGLEGYPLHFSIEPE
jgi:ATP-dependent Clp protease adaptor protein ClpS